jgi:hypothetical protein
MKGVVLMVLVRGHVEAAYWCSVRLGATSRSFFIFSYPRLHFEYSHLPFCASELHLPLFEWAAYRTPHFATALLWP